VPQGIGADTIATLEGWSREDVDAYAVNSQKRAAHARDNGYFDKSVIPVVDCNGVTILEKDDFIKPDTTMEGLAGLRASFEMMGQFGFDDIILSKYTTLDKINHVHTPGNSSGIVDGSSAVLIGSEKAGKDLGLTPRGRIVSTAVLSTDPIIMLTGAHRPGPGGGKVPEDGGPAEIRYRPVGNQRGLCLGGDALYEGPGYRPRGDQRQRWRHRHGPSPGRHRRHAGQHYAGRTGAPRT
jgi:acetyl-CoA C-acetyltransferase